MGETDEELRARIEARINARRDQMRSGDGGEPADVDTTPNATPPPDAAAEQNPMAGEQILEPSRAWSAPTPAPDGSPAAPWLTGTAPSVREAQQRAAELGMQDRPVGTAASLRPRRPWVKDSESDQARANDTGERPEVRRPPVSFVPEEQAAMPHRGAQTRRERREQHRAEKLQEKATAKAEREVQATPTGEQLTGPGPGDSWTTPTYGMPVNVPVPEIPAAEPVLQPIPEPIPDPVAPLIVERAPDPLTDPFQPHPKYAADIEPQSYGVPATHATPEPAGESTAWAPPEYGPPPSWGPPSQADGTPAEAVEIAPEPSQAATSSFPMFDLPPAPRPPTDFRAELAALRAQIAELAQELSSAPIPQAPSDSSESGGLFRRNRQPDQDPDDAP